MARYSAGVMSWWQACNTKMAVPFSAGMRIPRIIAVTGRYLTVQYQSMGTSRNRQPTNLPIICRSFLICKLYLVDYHLMVHNYLFLLAQIRPWQYDRQIRCVETKKSQDLRTGKCYPHDFRNHAVALDRLLHTVCLILPSKVCFCFLRLASVKHVIEFSINCTIPANMSSLFYSTPFSSWLFLRYSWSCKL